MDAAPYVLDCEALIGDPVVDGEGRSLGVLAHLMLDAKRGQIAYGVIGRGGVLGIGEKLHAIPWSEFTLDPDRGCLVIAIEPGALDGSPAFDRADWPANADPSWQAVDRYYRKRA